MNILKKIWWILIILGIVTIVILDRTHKAAMEDEYNSYRIEQTKQILEVDKLSSKTHENTQIFDTIKQTYRDKRDSLERLKLIYSNDKNKINELNSQLTSLDNKHDSIIKVRIKERKKFIKDIDSLKDLVNSKDREILVLKEEVNRLNKLIEN
jgi:hypothetical protein